MSIDRRRYPRRPYTSSVGCLYQGAYMILKAGEMGEGGIMVYSLQKIPIDQKILINFIIPNGSFVSVRAEIKNHTKVLPDGRQAHGVAFINLPFQIKREIRGFVAARIDLAV